MESVSPSMSSRTQTSLVRLVVAPLALPAGLLLGLLGATSLALPAATEIYRVELVGGTFFETRYWPIEDPEALDRVLLLTDTGNWIALPRRMVRHVAVGIEERGFGRRLDAQTVALGSAMNDAPAANASETPAGDALALLTRLFDRRFEALPPSHVEQFVEPEQAEGIPLRYSLEGLPPVGSATRFVTPQDRP